MYNKFPFIFLKAAFYGSKEKHRVSVDYVIHRRCILKSTELLKVNIFPAFGPVQTSVDDGIALLKQPCSL